MRPFKEYTKHVTKPGLRRSLLEVFFLFFIVIVLSAAFFYIVGEELMLQKFRSGDLFEDIPVPTDRIYRVTDSAIELAVDELVKEDESLEWLSDDVKEKYRKYFDKSELDRNIFEHYENILKLDEGDTVYIARVTSDTQRDLSKPNVSFGRFYNAFSNQPIMLLIPLLLVVLALLMAPRILKPIKKLTVSAEQLSRGDWDTSISVIEVDEIGILANTLEIMRTNLKEKIFELQNTAHELAIELDEKNVILEKAQSLQESFFPKHKEVGNFVLASGFMPSEHLGGDFFDIQDLGGGKLIFIFGDVEGHGLVASFNARSILTIFRLRCRENPDPVYLAEEISGMIYRGREIKSRQFSATALIGLIDQNTYNMTLVNAGHPNPVIWRNAEKKIEEITMGNPLLGFQDDYEYSSTNIEFRDDDKILLYTDGVIWCEDSHGNYFGQEKLFELVSINFDLPVEQMITVIEKNIGK
ncbi:SpoIIE family protein phosphatase, partial [bacterium]|nr:SpoIIE family protein phosphatase [bacterium]MBU1025978.1 SpoIIE family protein phosphatase [bacterium]